MADRNVFEYLRDHIDHHLTRLAASYSDLNSVARMLRVSFKPTSTDKTGTRILLEISKSADKIVSGRSG